MRRQQLITLLGLAIAARLVVACADTGADHSAGDPVATTQISVADNRFEPGVIQIARGDTVTWTWEGSAPHDVDGGEFRSEVQTSGTFEHTFETAGEYQYVCNIHPGMTGTVVVTDQ